MTSSESESDSDIENTTEKHKVTRDRRTENASNTPRRRKYNKSDSKFAEDIILLYLRAVVKKLLHRLFHISHLSCTS